MGLSHVVTAFTANLVALGYTLAREIKANSTPEPAAGALPVYIGPEWLEQNDTPPRVVFIPGEVGKDKFGPTDALGGPTRQQFIRFATAEVHVWGVDYAQAEQLVNDTIIALTMATGKGPLQLSTGGFVASTKHLQYGREYVFGMQLAIPVAKPTLATAPADVHAEHVGKMKFPNSIVTAC